ncbi:max dimerization protein 1-like [Oratosquilla oratoria]|uniref:max dimerization protein 1-like n=1 Tax=Oratosquilla oratoria TaxID=337810 RepID=UPI003F75D576
MSLSVLLQAAEYIERKEREMEHGYASSMPMPEEYSRATKRTRPKSKMQSNRKSFLQHLYSVPVWTTHNELEKNSTRALPLYRSLHVCVGGLRDYQLHIAHGL